MRQDRAELPPERRLLRLYRELSADYAAAFQALPTRYLLLPPRRLGYHVRSPTLRAGLAQRISSRGGNRLEMNDNYGMRDGLPRATC